MVNFSYRTWPGVEFARQLIAVGELGEPLHFEGHFFQDYAADPTLPFGWRFDKSVAGGGAFGDIGSHIMDIACALMGPAEAISARSRRLHERRPLGAASNKAHGSPFIHTDPPIRKTHPRTPVPPQSRIPSPP